MTDELHNHIAGMVCETDEPSKTADVTGDLIRRADALAAFPGKGLAFIRSTIQRIPPVQVGVKPLEWRRQSVDCEVAKTVLGDAVVQNESHALKPNRWGWWMVGSYEDDSPTGYEDDIEAAKAAAQADYEARIRSALIPTPAPSPDVPTPPDGWNVMKLGQVGWHVVQSANGWETSRIFGAECLLRSGGGDEFGPALDATPDGGRVAADAPTPSPDVGAQIADAVKAERERCAKLVAEYPERREKAGFDWRAEIQSAFDRPARALAAQEGGE